MRCSTCGMPEGVDGRACRERAMVACFQDTDSIRESEA